jgi:hypothetical protein
VKLRLSLRDYVHVTGPNNMTYGNVEEDSLTLLMRTVKFSIVLYETVIRHFTRTQTVVETQSQVLLAIVLWMSI